MDTNATSEILSRIGLKTVMSDYNRNHFLVYVPQDYPGSERAAMDAHYRMSEIVLLHKETGLRIEYLATESYYGDEVRYRFKSMFIITQAGNRLPVSEVDFYREEVITPEGTWPFKALEKGTSERH